ncbi:hypothetical protein [Halomarina litorea]|uniref:hypothetical protein n=1 Tax=Halomarina litorea TaxID=2961595 RepID=UPI0020C494F7|nr:hypothetical protein [Halomarina sp. BCD28]
MDDSDPTPPVDLPSDVADCLRGLDGHDLREAIVYAQELLRARSEQLPDVEPGAGEEVVRVLEHEGYTEVHMRHQRDDGASGAVYVYHVTTEPHRDGKRRHWSLVGRVEDRDDAGSADGTGPSDPEE